MGNRGVSCGTLLSLALVALVVGVAGGLGGAYLYLQRVGPTQGGAGPGPASGPGVTPRPSVQVLTEQDAIVKAVEAVDPAVVEIVATTVVDAVSPLERFFGGPRVRRGMGSGFIFEYEGRKLVLTNAHVVGNAQEIAVKFKEGAPVKGKLLGSDATADVAVVELEQAPAGLATAAVGNPDELNIGEWVVAIGHPYAFEHTVTVGVVSALGPRRVAVARTGEITRNVIQTDAAINEGNSGGPLVDLAGQVVGINSMIFSPTGATVGIGFAIPINDAMQIVHFLIHGGPWIGIEQAMPNSRGLSQYLGLSVETGIVVLEVFPGGPAGKAGLARGDVILAVDGKQTGNVDQLRSAIFGRQIGDTIAMDIQRGTEKKQLSVTTGTVPRGYYR